MKLFIKKGQNEQKGGLLGGNKGMSLYLSWRIDLTPEEKAFIEKYHEEIYLYGFTRGSTKGHDATTPPNSKDMVNNLIKGYTESGDIVTLRNDEKTINEGCCAFKHRLSEIATFGGEEVFDI